jgi:hypothetical protein
MCLAVQKLNDTNIARRRQIDESPRQPAHESPPPGITNRRRQA